MTSAQIDLIKILSINEVDQIFGSQFVLYMTWYAEKVEVYEFRFRFDFRLRFHNMKENMNMNTLTKVEKQVKEVYCDKSDMLGDMGAPTGVCKHRGKSKYKKRRQGICSCQVRKQN